MQVRNWLDNMGISMPDDVSLAHLAISEEATNWAGINVGRTARIGFGGGGFVGRAHFAQRIWRPGSPEAHEPHRLVAGW